MAATLDGVCLVIGGGFRIMVSSEMVGLKGCILLLLCEVMVMVVSIDIYEALFKVRRS